ncbi:MAG: NPCBM/NEW2 domain-containing protein [Phycisphaerae bacterium]
MLQRTKWFLAIASLGWASRVAPGFAGDAALDCDGTVAATRVRAVRIDGTEFGGCLLGFADSGAVEVRGIDGVETVNVDELMRLELIRPRQRARRGARDESAVDVFLADGGSIRAKIVEEAVGAVVVHCALGEGVSMPFESVAGIRFAQTEAHTAAAELFDNAMRGRLPGYDVLITRGADDANALRGTLEKIGPERGAFAIASNSRREQAPDDSAVQGQDYVPEDTVADARIANARTFRVDRVFGVVLAAGVGDALTWPVTFELTDGSRFSGSLPAGAWAARPASEAALHVATSFGVDMDVPLSLVTGVRLRSDRLVYVSDLTPTAQRLEGRLHRPWHVQLDRSVSGTPMVLGGQRFDKGLGVHSRTELDYHLDGKYSMFVATVGIDDAVRPRGSVVFRIVGDGTVLHETELLTGTSPPNLCRVDVTAVTVLTLVVDYGDSLDLADQADWGGARLIREAKNIHGGGAH